MPLVRHELTENRQTVQHSAEKLAAVGCCVFLFILLRHAGERLAAGAGTEQLRWLLVTCSAAAAPLVPSVLVIRRQKMSRGALGLRRPRRLGKWFLLWLIGMEAAALLLSAMITRFAGRDAPTLLPSDRLALGLACVQLCLISPAAEELMFRGVVQGLLLPYGEAAAVIGQALLFASLHAGAAQIAYALPLGLLLGMAARRSRSLLPGMLLHSLNNTVTFVLLLRGR